MDVNIGLLTTTAINVNGAASHTILSVPVGKKFVVFACYVVAGGAATVEVKSQASALTGELDVSATAPLNFGVGMEFPIWLGLASGDDLIFTTVGAVDFDGWVMTALVDG